MLLFIPEIKREVRKRWYICWRFSIMKSDKSDISLSFSSLSMSVLHCQFSILNNFQGSSHTIEKNYGLNTGRAWWQDVVDNIHESLGCLNSPYENYC